MLTEFYWILDKKLAGSAKPGLLNELSDDLEYLHRVGIKLICTLTENPIEEDGEDFNGFDMIHFPINDMGIPTPRHAHEICTHIIENIQNNKPALVHCRAGFGRTGTILACCLVYMGYNPDEAISFIRSRNRGYIQTQSQSDFVYHFKNYLSHIDTHD